MTDRNTSRRTFLKASVLGSATLALGVTTPIVNHGVPLPQNNTKAALHPRCCQLLIA